MSCLILDSYRCSFSFSLRMRASVLSLYFRYSASKSSLLGASAAAAVGGPLPSEVGGGRRIFSGLFGGRRIFSGLFGGRRIFSGLFGGGRRWTSGAGGSGPLGRRLRGDRERDLKNVVRYLVSGHQCWGSRSGYACFWASQIRIHLRIWIRILPFYHKKLKIMCLWVSYKKKICKNKFFASLNSLKKGAGSGVGSGSGSISKRYGSAPKCHGSPTLVDTVVKLRISVLDPDPAPHSSEILCPKQFGNKRYPLF